MTNSAIEEVSCDGIFWNLRANAYPVRRWLVYELLNLLERVC
jgi:hypothetical protein